MNALRIAVLSPAIALAVVIAAALMSADRGGRRKRPLRALVGRVFLYALAGAAVSLGSTIAWMVWYERSTGFSSGNAPLGWIFFYGPISVAVGELVALVHWWFQKPLDQTAPLEPT
jgi:hypothetical protein